MKCSTFFRCLRWIPGMGLKAALLEGHQRTCDSCREQDGWLTADLTQDPGEVDLWPGIQRRLRTEARKREPVNIQRSFRLLAASTLALVLTLFLREGRQLSPQPNPSSLRPVIHSLTLSGQAARAYYFQGPESSRLIVWAASQTPSRSKENDDDESTPR